MKTLIIAPHVDDAALCVGGLIMSLKNSEKAHQTHVLYCAVSGCRQYSEIGNTDTDTRHEEAKKASDFGGFEYTYIFENSNQLFLDAVPQKYLIDAIEDKCNELGPDRCFVPFGSSFNQDHRAVNEACITALRPVPKKFKHLVPEVYEYESPADIWASGPAFKPNTYLTLDNPRLEDKIRLIGCHESQVRHDPWMRSVENIMRLAETRGNEVDEKYAEAYRQLRRGMSC